ncbi:MAG: hypothetical protein A2600_13940 [Candidatus Lambdaproteobacteria bacterium RIFOXYD1_FULL_56_27]|uniref:Fluoride-specific ion channel FluC n=1 Tax=Candidatus Lambdaproteobacteria bacterium RIFOXYD2_FULL_56_26 TaxID=1817773 RepID=A0A1F6GNM4_9PROT|nr:MAG: hypothetical protein A2557_06165 [Candidatus Lambdaproteobacteria bacterium RIFOXYD2_FULL_56_26]OGG99890.1 MAG: hypothetical protein A2426_09900 [Candidatus Lambdaproteobacteria bacterium RIFOXYC1_FULL_56_13]OGH06289.1 MAG: hypothetical protein A2600_13940 [Candidatus Lambdaproteobacteria bacterium RIFOXYD1_FULL_56_27]
MVQILVIGLGGALGTVARFLLTNWANRLFPTAFVALGTLLVNGLGCLLIGLIAALFQARGMAGSAGWMFLITGVLGGLTTFSTFGLESFYFFKAGMTLNGIANLVAQLVLGLLMVYAGDRLGRIWL